MATYLDSCVIYAADGVTPLPTPHPARADWQREEIGSYYDGRPRYASRAVVEWQFLPLTATEYGQLCGARPAGGAVTFLTYRAGEVNPPRMAKCTGNLNAIIQGEERGAQFYGVALRFTGVVEVGT